MLTLGMLKPYLNGCLAAESIARLAMPGNDRDQPYNTYHSYHTDHSYQIAESYHIYTPTTRWL